MPEMVDVVVVGAGVVGLAVARQLAQAGREVLVLERHPSFGEETSSRNSEVIHAGIYYPKNSLKAWACVRGKTLLYDYCATHGVDHHRCGKLIVACDANQADVLLSYEQAAIANGVSDLQRLDQRACLALEPHVAAYSGLLSPSTGIVDSHAFMLSLLGELEAAGGLAVFHTAVTEVTSIGGALELRAGDMSLKANWIINAAGLEAVALARQLTPLVPAAHLAIGHYYSYSGPAPFSRLVYPVAEPGGLGVHVTLDLSGAVKFGPDVRWLEQLDYAFDDSQRESFISAIQRYFPALNADRLQPAYTGIRPKISGPGEPSADFRIDGPAEHGVAGVVNMLGIESPGLTASLALAEKVAELVAV